MSAKNKTLPMKIITTMLHSDGSFFCSSTVFGLFTMTRVSRSSRGEIDKLNIYYRTSSFLAERLLFLLLSEDGAEISRSLTSDPTDIISETSSSDSGLCCC
jgi:hypothetical protein